MKFILEGPDGAGKTTLAETLKGTTWHHSYYPELRTMFIESVKSIVSGSLCVDRMYYSELVYAPIYHKVQQRYGNMTRMLDRVIMGYDRTVVMCLPSYEVCHKAWSSGREEMVSDEAEFKKIYDAYAALKINTPHVYYDWTKETIDDLVMKVEALKVPKNLGPGIGSFKKGNILIVGDKPSNPLIDIDLPFVHLDGCSPWLADQLAKTDVPESDLYWINGFGLDGVMTDPSFIDKLEPSKIIALGSQAQRWCEIAGVNHLRTEHPQFWKRFRNSDVYPLVNILRSL